ncbi:MAG TPA: OmpH family outer membrane protein [Desulfomonilia bacterium]
MRKLSLIALICLMVGLAANLAYAEGNKIGTIDINRVMNDSKQGKAIQATMNKMFQDKQAEAEKYYQKVKSISDQLSAETPAMKQDAKAKLMKQYQQATQELKKFEDSADSELQSKKAALVRPMQDALVELINNFAKKNAYDYIFMREALVYAPESSDITQIILDAFDKEYLDNMAKESAKTPAPATKDSPKK